MQYSIKHALHSKSQEQKMCLAPSCTCWDCLEGRPIWEVRRRLTAGRGEPLSCSAGRELPSLPSSATPPDPIRAAAVAVRLLLGFGLGFSSAACWSTSQTSFNSPTTRFWPFWHGRIRQQVYNATWTQETYGCTCAITCTAARLTSACAASASAGEVPVFASTMRVLLATTCTIPRQNQLLKACDRLFRALDKSTGL